MRKEWSDAEAAKLMAACGDEKSRALAARRYLDPLLEDAQESTLRASGFHSLKTIVPDPWGDLQPAILFRATFSGSSEDYSALSLPGLRRLLTLADDGPAILERELRKCLLTGDAKAVPAEALLAAVLPGAYADLTVPDSILILTALEDCPERLKGIFGNTVLLLDEPGSGLAVARQAAALLERYPGARAMIWKHHGLLSWGDNPAREFAAVKETLEQAGAFFGKQARVSFDAAADAAVESARALLAGVAPAIRGALAHSTGSQDRLFAPEILHSISDREVMGLLDSQEGMRLASGTPLHPEHLESLGAMPLRFKPPVAHDPAAWRKGLSEAAVEYAQHVRSCLPGGADFPNPRALAPRVLLIPGLGLLTIAGSAAAARRVAETAWGAIRAKLLAPCGGAVPGLPWGVVAGALQKVSAASLAAPPLSGRVALVTGAAGAIGAGICERLLQQGCHVAVSDLPGPRLEGLADELDARFPDRVTAVAMDVTSAESVKDGFGRVARVWGGTDLVVANAGIAHVAPLEELTLHDFQRVSRINTEGTLLVLAEAARHFKLQGIGGDIVLVSTKNVFMPGAGFGAYSATKAAAHQLARIASQELAPFDVRVNMVSPDAVFSHGARRSGLWEEVGPGRMRARGLDAAGLEEYYRNRNLLKTRVTADHVARAVLFFATRQTPTTGATIPVDGGLPDSTPR